MVTGGGATGGAGGATVGGGGAAGAVGAAGGRCGLGAVSAAGGGAAGMVACVLLLPPVLRDAIGNLLISVTLGSTDHLETC